MLQRGRAGDVAAVVAWFADFEKQEALADACKLQSGYLYFVAGIHPDNIERTNKKLHDTWLEKVEELARRAECVGILSGLNVTRENGAAVCEALTEISNCCDAWAEYSRKQKDYLEARAQRAATQGLGTASTKICRAFNGFRPA